MEIIRPRDAGRRGRGAEGDAGPEGAAGESGERRVESAWGGTRHAPRACLFSHEREEWKELFSYKRVSHAERGRAVLRRCPVILGHGFRPYTAQTTMLRLFHVLSPRKHTDQTPETGPPAITGKKRVRLDTP